MSNSVGQHIAVEGHPAGDFNTHRCSFITIFFPFFPFSKVSGGVHGQESDMNFVLQVQNRHTHTSSTRHGSSVILQAFTSSASHL